MFSFFCIVIPAFILAYYFGKSNLASEDGVDGLAEYSDISNFDFYLSDEVVEFGFYELSSDSVEFLNFRNEGVALNVDDGVSFIELEYDIQLAIGDRLFCFRHYANLSDVKTPGSLYENYYYDDGDLSENVVYGRFEIVAF